MPVLGNAVRPDAFVAFHEEIIQFRFATGAAHATQAVRDDAVSLDELATEQRNQRQQNTRRITTRRRDEASLADFITIDFRQTINGLAEQIRRAMFVPVKFAVNGSILDPEIRAEINDMRAGFQKRRSELHRDA